MWDILLVGGAAGVGKTTLASRLARRFDVPLTRVDDFQVLLEWMTTPEQQPALHFWSTHPDPGSLSAQEIQSQGLEILDVLQPGLRAVIDDRLDEGIRGVFEGDFIHPALAAGDERVRGLFVLEPDEEQIIQNFLDREPETGRQELRAQVSVLRSAWLAEQCARLGVPAVQARPWETLEQRALEGVLRP